MVNIDDFIKRLELILDYYNLSASVFADKIGVQRSSLSHLLSGRNKPSLDFIIKVVEVFPEVDLYWILNGKGNFPKSETNNIVSSNIQKTEHNFEAPDLFSEKTSTIDAKENPPSISNHPAPISIDSNNIEQIVIFYKNGTFKHYNP
jgi:transcriptional regulator with XRE-family HTH domain